MSEHNRLTAAPQGPLYGPVAHAMACGAHLAVYTGAPWNSFTDPADTEAGRREQLAESWGITSPEEWREQAEALVADDGGDPDATLVLRLRVQAAHRYGGRADAQLWQWAIAQWCAAQRTGPGREAELRAVAERVERYEHRFRADGLLPPHGYVTEVIGYDFGRAVNMARWGVAARYCDHRAAEAYALRAGEQCRRFYASWPDFSSGYALGRLLRFDEDSFGLWYESVLVPHQVLMSHPHSPWRHLPFR
ncbi:DUF1266 domain-containing protein [Allonocardiopsis opalescens]|uniref:Uncharacterized protein DUF1266 n=1 Tax=Allonocardiopsis opalescens TaxID=1144618 RepID=A0A2T0PU91_9ACTN|nr:DUF1266 domain-containing protein [Allonocardiopsis opalescens]PRX92467.1 uncharacterized protein DUF1266 [Allonocardiopsis opalescens]